MFGISKKGFTLIEIMVAIALLAVMAAVIIPNLAPRRSQEERKEFIERLNELTQLGWQNALITNTLHRVYFDFKKKSVRLEQDTGQKETDGQAKFGPLERSYITTTITWPDHLQIKNFFIEGFDEMSRFVGRDTGELWFFIVPDGLTQRVTINLIDNADMLGGRPAKVGLVLNPFNARFIAHDEFKK